MSAHFSPKSGNSPPPPPRSPGPKEPTGSGGNGAVPGVVTRYNDIIKSPEDKRQYRGLVLSNRIKVLLVSDPDTDKSAAAFDVNVGYLSDPDDLPGLAHFCEHMLFLGTEKYPEENEYSKFLSENGGSSNASTASDHTTYYFDILPPHLSQALDIFAQFFIAPLFTEGATEREIKAVNSEHEKNVSSDLWRLDQLSKSTANPSHAFHKFGTGNSKTLSTIPKAKGIDLRKRLLEFHSKWYSSNIMTLCVVGKESLDELEAMVVPLFSAVEDRGVEAPRWPQHPFPPDRRRKRILCIPVKDLRTLSIDFPIPDTRMFYKSGPGHYLSHLLGHEGPGSLLEELKKRGWSNSLVGGTRIGGRGFAFFGVQVDLTEEGIRHIDDIVKLVFQYIAMLKIEGPQKWVWEEQRDLMALEFMFKDSQDPRSFAIGHVHLMQDFPMEDILSAYYLMSDWKPELIDKLLTSLTPENVRLGAVSKSFSDKCTMREAWYGTKYLLEDIEESKLNEWRSVKPCPELHLPPVNEFIPSRLTLDTSDDPTLNGIAPEIIKDTPLMRLWFKKDNEFRLPKAIITFDIVCPLAYSDPLTCNLTSIWVLLIRDSLQHFAYAAELAGLRWSVGNAKHGISVTIDGYDDKQAVLLDKIISLMINFKTDPKRFYILKENHVRAIRNFEAEQPYQHAVYQQAVCLSHIVWSRCQLMDTAETMTPDMMDAFVTKMVRKVHIEGFMFGNLTREKALEIADSVEKHIPKDAAPLLAQELLLHREIEIEKGSWHVRSIENKVHSSSCALLYYACGVRDMFTNVRIELLAHTLSEPCFNILRTKEQLGYIVFSGIRRSNGTQGFRVIVQGDRHPEYLEERIETFLQGALENLENMTEEEYLRHRSSLALQKLEKPKKMSTKASGMWAEIVIQVYDFDRQRREVEELNKISKADLIQFYKRHIGAGSPQRRKLSVYVVSTAEGGAGKDYKPPPEDKNREKPTSKIEDLVEFKSHRKLYHNPPPHINIPRKGKQCKL